MHKFLMARLSLLQWFQFLVWGSWFVTAGNYMMHTLKYSGRQVGSIYSLASIAATVSPLMLGVLADKYISIERLLAILHFVGAILLLWLSHITEFSLFFSIMAFYMVCYLPTFSLTGSYCFHHIEDAKRDFPKVRVWGTIAWVVAGLFIGFLDVEQTAIPFMIASGISFVLGVYCLTLPKTTLLVQNDITKKTWIDPDIRKLFLSKDFLVMVISIGLICIPLSFYYSFVNPFMKEMNISNAVGKMTIGQMTEIGIMVFLPWLFRTMRFKWIIYLGLLAWGVRYGLFALGYSLHKEWIVLLGIALHGMAYVFAMLSAQIYIDTKVPIRLRSTAQGFFTLLTMGVMGIIGAFIAGELVSHFALDSGNHDWVSIWMFPFVIGVVVSSWFFIEFKPNSSWGFRNRKP